MKLTRLLLTLSLPLYVVDQATKFWTIHRLNPPSPRGSFEALHLIKDVFHWGRIHNQGVAFGMGNGTSWAPVVFLIVPLIALALIRVFWVKGFFESLMSRIAVALLLTGIFGNLTDRLVQGFLLEAHKDDSFWMRLSEGYVVDFAMVKLPLYDKIVPNSGGWWPAFNVADSCICIAALLIFISGFRDEMNEKKSKKSKQDKKSKPDKAEAKSED